MEVAAGSFGGGSSLDAALRVTDVETLRRLAREVQDYVIPSGDRIRLEEEWGVGGGRSKKGERERQTWEDTQPTIVTALACVCNT